MDRKRVEILAGVYRDSLLGDVEPFWSRHGIDHRHGGFLTCLDFDGEVYSTDKNIWMTGRMVWFYARLCNRFGRDKRWLGHAKQGARFLIDHCFDTHGVPYENVSRDGSPIGKPGNPFGLCFGAMGLAEYFLAAGEDWAKQRAMTCFDRFLADWKRDEKVSNRRAQSRRMILLAMAPALQRIDSRSVYRLMLDQCIEDLFRYFCKPDLEVVLEYAGRHGELLTSSQFICPGHALESTWFTIDEACCRRDADLVRRLLPLVKWNLEKGWDRKYGGLYLQTGLDGGPVTDPIGEMKYYWPQVEALCAALIAYAVTGEHYWVAWFERIHDYFYSRFQDREFGEFYAYLNRDNTPAKGHASRVDGSLPSGPVKGDLGKCAFHVARSLMVCLKLLDRIGRGTHGISAWQSLR